jgi:hypothetical protein
METIKNVAQILVATAADSYAAGTIADLAAGELAIAYPNGVLVASNDYTSLAAGDKYIVAVKGLAAGSNLLLTSDVITKGQETSMTYAAYAASQGQIDYIGYNGTSGSITVTNSNIYTIRMYVSDNTTMGFMQQLVKEGFYKSDASSTQAEIALGLAKSLVANFSREPEEIVRVERVNSGTSIATSAGAVTVTKGSKYVSIPENSTDDDAGKYDTDGSSIAVGDIIRFGHATTKTYPCYKVVAITGAATSTIVLELDMKYQGASEAIAAASVGVIVSTDEGDWGLKLSGQKKTFVKGVFNSDSYVSWKTVLQDFGATLVTESQAISKGTGTYEWVAEREFEWQMNNYPYRTATPDPSYHQDAASASTYGIFKIDFPHAMDTALGGQANSPKTLYVACVAAGVANVGTALGISTS